MSHVKRTTNPIADYAVAKPYIVTPYDTKLDDAMIRHILTFRPSPVKGATGYKNGRTRPLLFLGDMTDIFGEWVPDHMIDPVIAAIALRPDVDVIVLTKRAKRMREYFVACSTTRTVRACNEDGSDHVEFPAPLAYANLFIAGEDAVEHDNWPLPNLWMYVSVEDQATADERIPHLLACPAVVRGVSAEPLVGPVDLSRWVFDRDAEMRKLMTGPGAYNRDQADSVVAESLDHAIIGGESGPGARGARSCNVEWIRSLVRQGAEAKVATFVKQLGSRPTHSIGLAARVERGEFMAWQQSVANDTNGLTPLGLCDRKGGEPHEWPPDLRVRQMPGGGR